MNRIILTLMFADLMVITGFGFIDPILAVYYDNHIVGSSIFGIGIASAVFLLTKSVVQVPVARYVDTHNDMSDLRWLIVGYMLIATVPICYLFATHMYHIYAIQFLYGIGSGIGYATWLGLWSLHLDRSRESFEWSLYSTLVSVGAALAAALGAGIAEIWGFAVVFTLVTILSVLGAVLLLSLTYMPRIFRHSHEGGQV